MVVFLLLLFCWFFFFFFLSFFLLLILDLIFFVSDQLDENLLFVCWIISESNLVVCVCVCVWLVLQESAVLFILDVNHTNLSITEQEFKQ